MVAVLSSSYHYVIFFVVTSTTIVNAKSNGMIDKMEIRIYRDGNSSKFEPVPMKDLAHGLDVSANFDRRKPLVVVIHGANQGANKRLMRAIVDSFAISQKFKYYNIIATHLPELMVTNLKNKFFFGVLPRSEVVGNILGDVLGEAIKKGLAHPSRISMIGYCMGSHVAGYAARRIRRDHNIAVDFIAGLDPVGLGYELILGTQTLSSFDARTVHQFHSSAYYLAGIGTADFIFNGGLYQPGCAKERFLCSHARAVWFFAESVVREKAFVARQCSSIGAFNLCLCGGQETKIITFPPDKSAVGNYYVRTHKKSPFGAGQQGSKGVICSRRYSWVPPTDGLPKNNNED